MLYNNLKSIGYNGGQYKAIMKGSNCIAGLSDAYSYIKITSNMECDVEIEEGYNIIRTFHFNKGDNYILASEGKYTLDINANGSDFPVLDFDFTYFKTNDCINIIGRENWELGKIIFPDNISLGLSTIFFSTDNKRDFRGKKIHYMYIPNSYPNDITLGTISTASYYIQNGMPSFGGLKINSIEGIDSSVTKIKMLDDRNLKNNLTKIMNANQDNHSIKIYVTEKAYNLVDDELRTLAEQKNFTIEIGH